MKKLKLMPNLELRAAIEAESFITPAVISSMDLATTLHADQIRKDPVQGRVNTPYIEHCLRNVLRLIRYDCTDIDTLIAAVLHDAVEDSPFVFAPHAANEIEARAMLRAHIARVYGEAVAVIVDGVTNPYQDAAARRSMTDAQKFVEYREKVARAIASSEAIFLVKLTDYIDNAGSLHHTPISVVPKAQRLATKYYPLVDTFRTVGAYYRESGTQAVDWDAIDYTLSCIGDRLRIIKGD